MRCVDFMIDAGSNGLCILANFSEQFALSDAERELLDAHRARACRRPRAGDRDDHALRQRTVCIERSRRAAGAGRGDGHGDAAVPRRDDPRARSADRRASIARLSDAISIPIMIQDAPVAGTPLSAALLARMAREIDAGRLLQDRDGRRGSQAARADPPRRRRGRRAVGRRGGHHAAGRPGRRRHRRDDRRRLPRRHSPDRRCPSAPDGATRPSRCTSAGCR